MKNPINHSNFYTTIVLLGALLYFGVACDTGVDSNDDPESATISGQVNENEESSNKLSDGEFSETSSDRSSTGKTTAVEGAVITAVAIHSDGSVTALDGQTTTNAEGKYSFTVEGEGASDHVRVIANADGGFKSSVIVLVNGKSSVNARPMTIETHAQAEVYIEAKSKDDSDSHTEGVTTADVATFVNTEVASEISAGAQSAADIGKAIANAIKAQISYNSKTNAGVNMSSVAKAKSQAYAQLQSDISAAANANARATAIAKFEEAYLNMYTDNGTSAQIQAELHQTCTGILVKASGSMNGNARLGIRKIAERIRANATALAIEAKFNAESASQSTLDALVNARVQMITKVRTAASAETIIEAKNEYKATVDTHIESTFGITAEMRTAAETRTETAHEALINSIANLSVIIGNIGEAAAEAYAGFYTAARAETSTSLQSTGIANAEAATDVIVSLRIMKS